MTMSPYLWCQILCASVAFDIKFLCVYTGVCVGGGGYVCVSGTGGCTATVLILIF